jgi:hypothetical protein
MTPFPIDLARGFLDATRRSYFGCAIESQSSDISHIGPLISHHSADNYFDDYFDDSFKY